LYISLADDPSMEILECDSRTNTKWSEQWFYDKNQLKSKFLQLILKQMVLIYKLY